LCRACPTGWWSWKRHGDLEQGREVFAVPGSPLDPRAEGTNDLIRDGATLCASIDHVTNVLEPLIAAGPKVDKDMSEPLHLLGTEELWDELDLPDIARPPTGIVLPHGGLLDEAGEGDRIEVDLVSLLGPSPVGIDDLARQSGLSIGHVQMALLELEIAGRLERHGGNAVSLLAKT
jgi:DNA processing protein